MTLAPFEASNPFTKEFPSNMDNGFNEQNNILNSEVLRKLRMNKRESQTKFWKRFGVTQSRGSRFELGVEIPYPVAILVSLYLAGTVSDGDLLRARRNARPKRCREKRPAES
jgi:hypothetical protein